MGLLDKLIGKTPFGILVAHTQKVHACVELIRPLADALLAEDYARIDELHHEMSRTEHEADILKDEIRQHLTQRHFFSVGQEDLRRYLARQDDVADAAEDFAVVLRLRQTRLHPELKEDFLAFVDKVIECSERLLEAAEELNLLAETAFTGAEAKRVLDMLQGVSEREFESDKLQRRFARHYYQIEDQLDPVTIMMYEKYCNTLGKAANKAEGTAKYLRNMIEAR